MSPKRYRIVALILVVIFMMASADKTFAQVRDSLNHHKLKLALVLPFELSRNTGVDAANPDGPGVHPYSMPSLHFYEGARLAIDSLLKSGYYFDYAAFETPQDSSGIRRMFIQMKSDSFNVVVGSFPDNLVALAVDFSARYQMKLVLTQALSTKACKGKDHCLIAYASTASQCRFAVQKLIKLYPSVNFIIVKGRKTREIEVSESFRTTLDSLLPEKGNYSLVDLTTSTISSIESHLVSGKQNIVIFVTSDEPVVNSGLSFINKNAPHNTIVLGLPTWMNFESVDFNAMDNIRIAFMDNNFINQNNPERIRYRKRFVGVYFDDPMSSGYSGFDLIKYLVIRLSDNPEKSWTDAVAIPETTSIKTFSIKRMSKGGFENNNISVAVMVDMKMIPIEDLDKIRNQTDTVTQPKH